MPDHGLVTVSCALPLPPPFRKISHPLWHYRLIDWSNLGILCRFSIRNCCFSANDTSLCADKFTKIIMAGMKATILIVTSNTSKPWLDGWCSGAFKKQNLAHKRYRIFWKPTKLYISARVRAAIEFHTTKENFGIKLCNELSLLNTENALWPKKVFSE